MPDLIYLSVYRVSSQKVPGTNQTIDVTQFAGLVDSLRDQWPKNANGSGEGLLLFSGDLFSPSIESSVTRGSHMVRLNCFIMEQLANEAQVPIINELSPDVSLTGK
ncbi:hypothetical protein FRC03_006693 [Tulasnella sp. 419]|nr:hypothetical protein FRC03_006693 [Tulasnella sp. 419]